MNPVLYDLTLPHRERAGWSAHGETSADTTSKEEERASGVKKKEEKKKKEKEIGVRRESDSRNLAVNPITSLF